MACFLRVFRGLGRTECLQESAVIASYRVAWTLTRQKMPFNEAEMVKDCMLEVIDEVVVILLATSANEHFSQQT